MSRKHNTKHRRSRSHYDERLAAQPKWQRTLRGMSLAQLRARQAALSWRPLAREEAS